MALSNSRKKQLEQAKQNAKNKAKQESNKKLIQSYNASNKNKPKQTVTAKTNNRSTQRQTSTARSTNTQSRTTQRRTASTQNRTTQRRTTTTQNRTTMNGSLGSSFGNTSTAQKTAKNPRTSSNRGIQTARHTAENNRATARNRTTMNSSLGSSFGRQTAKTGMNGALGASFGGASAKVTPKAAVKTNVKTVGKTWNEKEERQKAIDTLNANSTAWHNTTNEAEKNRLHAANDRIRKKFGMSYEGTGGTTYLPKASGGKTTISNPVVPNKETKFNTNFKTQAERQARYDELNKEIDRMQKQYPYLIAMDQKNRSLPDQVAALPWLATHPSAAISGINGDAQYQKMSAASRKQADAMYQMYKRLNDEADAVKKSGAGKSIASGIANTALNAAGAVENFGRFVTSAGENALSGALKLAGANNAGKFWEDTARKTMETSFSDAAMQKVNDWAQPVGAAKSAQELAGSGARMIPGIALNAATGGASKVSSLLNKAPLDGASMAMIFGDSAASGAREALQDGASMNRAMAYGVGNGLTEVGTEKMFGGIPGMNEGAIKTGGGVLGRALDILGEGAEEATSTLVNPYLKRATYDKNAQNATAQELWDSAKGGIALAGIMQGANGISERLANRRYGATPEENVTSIHDANADMRAADQMDSRLHPNTPQALPTAQRLALPEGNTRTANTIYAGEQGAANNLRAFNQTQTPDVMYVDRNGGVSGEMNAFPNVFYASTNGQVSDSLPPRLYLPEGRQTKTRFSDRVTGTETIPQYSVDEAGNPNGGLTGNEMQWAKLLQDNANKTGVSVQQYVDEIVGDTFDRYNEALQAAEQYVKDYKPQGVSVIQNGDGTGFRASNNEQWYSDFYRKNGKKPNKSEAAQIAAEMVNRDIRNGGGSWIGADLAADIKTALEIQNAGNVLGNDVLSANIVDGNLVIQRGERGYTKDIRDTSAARNGIVSTPTQGTPQAPLNTGTGHAMSGTANTQSAPSLAAVQQQRESLAARDINPKLTRAGAEMAQDGLQTVQNEIAQPAQETAQAAMQNDTARTVTPESSVGAAEGGFDPYSRMVNEYGAIPEGMNPARTVDVPQSTNGEDRVRRGVRTFMESGITTDEMIPEFERHVAEGLFSYNAKTDKGAMDNAVKTINKKGWQGAYAQWQDVTDGLRPATKDDIVLAKTMYTAAEKAGDTQTAMRLAAEIAAEGTRAGQVVQAFRLLKRTTPEGRLYYLQKSVEIIQREYQKRFDKKSGKDLKKELKRADSADKKGKQAQIVSDTNAAVEQAAQEVAKEAVGEAPAKSKREGNGKKTLPKASDKGVSKNDVYDGKPKDRYTPAADWAKETGNDLAKRIANKLNPAPTQRPVSRTILSDLMKFAEEHALPKKQQAPKRQAVDRLRDYFANKDFYTKAWNEARNTLKEKYKGNTEALDALESFTDATIDYNADPLHTQKVIMNALMDDIKETGGLKDYLARNTLGAGEQNVTQLADRLIAETGVTGTDAEVLRSGINHAYEDMMDGKSGTKLETMIRDTLKSGKLNLTDVAKMSAQQKDVIGQTVSGLLQWQYGIDEQYANAVSDTIISEYTAEVNERAKKILADKFKERGQRAPREFWDVFEEYANLGAFNGEYAQKATEKLFGQQGITLNEDLVQEFLNAADDDARADVVDKIYDDIAAQIPKTAGDLLNAWRYFAMLGNPRTHIRNVMGNIAYMAPNFTSNKISAIGQKALPKEQRTRALFSTREAREFAKQDLAKIKDELGGSSYTSDLSEIKQRQKLFPKPLQWLIDKNGSALDAEDMFSKKHHYVSSMASFLTARGWDVNNLSETQLNEAREHAKADALKATFNDASALADALNRIEKTNKATEIIIGGLVPFKRTPTNIVKRSFELSPVGLLKAITYDAAQVKKGNMNATTMIDHIGQGLTGTGMAAIGAFMAAQGVFSAGSSDDDKEANLDAAMGQQEYALNIGGKSYTIDWAAPSIVPLAIGGELYNALSQKYDDETTAYNQALATISRMFEPLLNMTMLSGVGSTVSSAAYNNSNPIFGVANNIAQNYVGQVVPTVLGQIARTVDNTRRSTYADKNSPVPASVQKFMQRQANKIPGLSKNQPAYTDVWGREQKNGPDNTFARAMYNFFSPGYLADTKSTDAEKAIKDLYQATGDSSILPSKPQSSYKDADGVKKFLTAEQYSTLTSEKGKISLDAIDKLTKSAAYKNMSNDERVQAIADIYKYANAVSANKVYGKELEGTVQTVKDSGIEPGLYYAYKEMEDNYNESMETYEARDQVFNAIKSDSSLSDKEKNGLYHTLLIKGTSDSAWEKYTEISDKVTAEEYVDAMIQKQAISKEGEDIEKGRAALEATEFSYYLDAKGYSGEKRTTLENTFKFYSMVKADPANYTFDMIRENGGAKEKAAIGEVEQAGISAAQYANIKSAASGVTYEKGKSGAKLQAVAAVVSKNTASYEQYAAVMHALGYKKIDGHYQSGGKLPEDKQGDTGITVNRAASQKTSSAGFVNPVTAGNAIVTSSYGGRQSVKTSTGYSSSNHDGIDIGGTGGNLNGQAADTIGGGKVIAVGYDEKGYGNYVEIDHGNGYTSLYGHLQKATVKQGDTVSAGQQVGVIGSTGSSTAPHLHLRVRKNGQSVDPSTVIPGFGK